MCTGLHQIWPLPVVVGWIILNAPSGLPCEKSFSPRCTSKPRRESCFRGASGTGSRRLEMWLTTDGVHGWLFPRSNEIKNIHIYLLFYMLGEPWKIGTKSFWYTKTSNDDIYIQFRITKLFRFNPLWEYALFLVISLFFMGWIWF